MFERFTDQAREVVALAQEEAKMLNHGYIGTEHLLLGLLRESDGIAARVMLSHGISLATVRRQVGEVIGRDQPSEHMPFTPRAKKVLELSLREATELSRRNVGTEHVMLGLIREGKGVAVQVLVGLGADLDGMRQQVTQMSGQLSQDASNRSSGARSRASVELPRDPLELDSLAAAERWVGVRPDLDDLDREIARVRREKEAAIGRQDFDASVALREEEKQLLATRRVADKDDAATARMPLFGELARVRAELERLRAILRQHGIDPDNDVA